MSWSRSCASTITPQDNPNRCEPDLITIIRNCAGLAALLLFASACGLLPDRGPTYAGSQEVPPIDTPPGLNDPETESNFEIPGYSLPELAAQGDESRPPRVLTSAEAEQARSRIRFGPQGLYLEVDETAADTWRELGDALDEGDMSIEQVLDGQRRFRVVFAHEPIQITQRNLIGKVFMFWKAPEYLDYSGTYLFEVQRETTDRTRVAILDAEGNILKLQRAEFVLDRLRERLG